MIISTIRDTRRIFFTRRDVGREKEKEKEKEKRQESAE
jgi:hypothetical protein